jgi:cyanophycin synthetase
MSEYSKGGVIYFTRDASNAVVVQHRADEGRAVIVRDGSILLCDGEDELVLCALADVQVPMSAPFEFNVENVLAAVSAAWAYGLEDESIAAGLRSFERELEALAA